MREQECIVFSFLVFQAKDRELVCSREAVSLHSSAAASEQKKLLSSKENESLEIKLQLQFAEQKIATFDGHIRHLNERISQLEEELAKSYKVCRTRKKDYNTSFIKWISCFLF